MKETELNKVLNYMKQYVENKYEHDSEPMLNYKDIQLVLEEIERLNKALQDIKNFIDRHTKIVKETKTKYLLTNVVDDNILIDIVNKALGSDKE